MKAEFLSDLVGLGDVSPGRLDRVITDCLPAVWMQCDGEDVAIPRRAFCESVIEALPRALQLTWLECVARSLRAGTSTCDRWRGEFFPTVEVFGRGPIAVPLVVGVAVDIRRIAATDMAQRSLVHVALWLAALPEGVRKHSFDPGAIFFEKEADLVANLGF